MCKEVVRIHTDETCNKWLLFKVNTIIKVTESCRSVVSTPFSYSGGLRLKS
jgi:hypothetical protein